MSVVELQLPDQDGGVVPWPRFVHDFRREWRTDQHLSVIGKTGSGKSWLERWLLEVCRPQGRVYLFDLKASDPILRAGFRTVKDTPGRLEKLKQRLRSGEREWVRIVPSGNRQEARRLVHAYMNSAWRQGSTTVVLDEMRAIAGRTPNLGLSEQAHVLWQRGRARGVSVMGGAQSPVHIPRAALEEIDHLFVGRIADSRRLPLLRDVVGDRGAELMERVRSIKAGSYVFVYVPPDGPLQMVKAPATMPSAKAKRAAPAARKTDLRPWLYGTSAAE